MLCRSTNDTTASGANRTTKGKSRRASRALGAALAAALALSPFVGGGAIASAQEREPTVAPGVVVPVGPSVTATTVDRITDNPEPFYEREVAVIGEIGDVLGPRSFTLEDDDLLFDEEMAIVGNRPLVGRNGEMLNLEALSGRRALVTGTVHQLNVGAFEERLGIDLADEDFADWGGRPAMIARSIMLDPVLYAPPGAYPYGPPVTSGAPGVDPVSDVQNVTVDAITDNPEAYYGRKVTISGEVGQALGPRSFTVEDSDLLFDEVVGVIGTGPLLDRNGRPYSADALDDLHVMVTGTVRYFTHEELERELGVDLSGEGVDAWEGQPVIVAESVRQLR